MARRIELSCPDARNVLINALQFDEEMESGSPLRQALFHEMQDPFPGVLWDDVFDLKMLRRVALIPGLLLLLFRGSTSRTAGTSPRRSSSSSSWA